MATSGGNIVAEWLRSLRLGQYAESFIDNGYDDLEICKQVGDPDLDAIGVFNPAHRGRLLASVRTLREEGAASVYFSLEESVAVHEECLCDNVSARTTSSSGGGGGGSGRCASEKELPGASTAAASSADSSCSSQEAVAKYADEYEEGKAELVKIPRMQLKLLLREKLATDGIQLTCQPYTTPDGERGYLEGLASRYADLFSTHYGDVLAYLEDLRRRDWADTMAASASPGTPPPPLPSQPPQVLAPDHYGTPALVASGGGLVSSQSQPIYVPGKYSPSSCLSDKEEDEIYGFGYGVYGAQMARQQQQRLLNVQSAHQPLFMQQQNYESCLSPRSAYFYEFPPNEQNYTNTAKKKTTFSRFLRGLKTSHRKEKHGGSSPRHGRAAAGARGVPQRVDTPDSVLQSGLGLTDLGQHAVLRSMVDPRDYDRLRHLQMNGGGAGGDGAIGNTFEETIYKLKLQEALRKREKFTKEHEEILRDIKQGLLQLGKEGIRGPLTSDDTYMYDEDARMLAPHHHHLHHPHPHHPHHWYDEPPYESDPEDFLMGGSPGGPTATIQNGRVCFTLNLRQEPNKGEGVISLRSAGDISLPRGEAQVTAPRGGTPRRGLILPQAGYPPTIIPLTHSRDRESGDYAGSDVQSVSSRLSTLSVDTSRSEACADVCSPQYYTALEEKIRHFRKTNSVGGGGGGGGGYARSEDGLSPSQSSDYEDQDDADHEDYSNCSQQVATVHMSGDGRSAGVAHLVGKVRGLREDVQRKISRLKQENAAEHQQQQQQQQQRAFVCSASSVESLPSGSGSSTQALVRAGSNHSSISTEDVSAPSPTSTEPQPHIIGRAKALVDCTPSPYDKEALKFKKGDIIEILSMNASGQWKGICHGRKGTFKFINVELLSERSTSSSSAKVRRDLQWRHQRQHRKGKPPLSVEDLLLKMGLQEYISVFVLNGYEDLELFKEIEPSDLDYLGIISDDHRAKLLTAVQLLHDMDSGSEGDIAGSSSDGGGNSSTVGGSVGDAFGRRQFPRDSGCYDAPTTLKTATTTSSELSADHHPFCDPTNNLDSVVEQCNNEILARVRQAQKNALNLKEDIYQPNIPNSTSTEAMLLMRGKTKDSYVSLHGQTTLTDPCRRSLLSASSRRRGGGGGGVPPPGEESCEADQKSHSVKYVVGGASGPDVVADVVGVGGIQRGGGGGGGCLSEKSSDSGVSSSSLSSTHPKEQPRSAVLLENPHNHHHTTHHQLLSFTNCANNRTTTTSNTANKNLA